MIWWCAWTSCGWITGPCQKTLGRYSSACGPSASAIVFTMFQLLRHLMTYCIVWLRLLLLSPNQINPTRTRWSARIFPVTLTHTHCGWEMRGSNVSAAFSLTHLASFIVTFREDGFLLHSKDILPKLHECQLYYTIEPMWMSVYV